MIGPSFFPNRDREWGTAHRVSAFLIGFCPFFSIAAANVAIALFLSLWLFDLARKKTSMHMHRTPFDFVLGAYLLVWLAAALAGHSPLGSLRKIGIFEHPIILYLLLFAYGGELVPSALWGVGVGAGLNVVYGWGQWVTWQWIYNFAGGERPSWLMAVKEEWRIYLTLSPGQGRIHGAFHLLTYSELLLPIFFFLGARFFERGKSILFLAGFLLTGVALLFTAERGPALGAFVGVLLMAFLHPRRQRLIGPLLFLLVVAWFNPVVRYRLGGTMESAKKNHRVNLWKGGWYIASRHWWIGVGPGQIGPVTQIYKKLPNFPPNPDGQERDMHSFYMQRLAEMGVPGLVVSCWVIFVFMGVGRTFYRNREKVSMRFAAFDPETINALALGIWASFVAYGFINLTERAFDDAEVSLVFWTLAATAVWFVRQAELRGPVLSDEAKFAGSVIP